MKGGAEPPFIFDHPAAAALSAETKAEGPAAEPPGGDAESPFIFDRPAAAAAFGKDESGRPGGRAVGRGR